MKMSFPLVGNLSSKKDCGQAAMTKIGRYFKVKYLAYWPKGYDGAKSTLQSRNALIGNFTEKWTTDLIHEIVKDKGLFAVQGAICNEIALSNQSPADVVISKHKGIQQNPEDIMAIIEVKAVFKETYRVLVTGGRACINIANLGRKPYIPLHSYIIEDMLEFGFHMRGEIIWNKASSASPSTAWGSWQSAANPVLRDIHEYILIFSKESFSRRKGHKKDTITKEDFLEWTKSVWTFPAVSAKSIGHPAPFPEELPHRLIQLYSFKGDIVLDPFCGSGTACLAALKDGRHYIGYDIEPSYVKLTDKRIKGYLKQLSIFK
jgi:site-specific DNA-methyltransferase (adenine-specific)